MRAIEAWWDRARPLDAKWVSAYAARAKVFAYQLPPGDDDAAPVDKAPDPHAIQARVRRLDRARRGPDVDSRGEVGGFAVGVTVRA